MERNGSRMERIASAVDDGAEKFGAGIDAVSTSPHNKWKAGRPLFLLPQARMVREAMKLRQEGLIPRLLANDFSTPSGQTLSGSARGCKHAQIDSYRFPMVPPTMPRALPSAEADSPRHAPSTPSQAGLQTRLGNKDHSRGLEAHKHREKTPQPCSITRRPVPENSAESTLKYLSRAELVHRLHTAETMAKAMLMHLRTATEMLHGARQGEAQVSANLAHQTKEHESEVRALTCEVAALRQAALPRALEKKDRVSKIEHATRGGNKSESNRGHLALAGCQCNNRRAKFVSLDRELRETQRLHVEELLVMQKSYTASETQLLRTVQKQRDEVSRANKQISDQAKLIEEQEEALKTFRKHESRLQRSLSKASSDELRRARKLELLEEAGAQLLRIFNSSEGGIDVTLYNSRSSEPDGPVAGTDDESESGCERSDSRAASEALNRRIDKLVALACTQLDMLAARA